LLLMVVTSYTPFSLVHLPKVPSRKGDER
jgi:hypothetical protein